MTDNLRKPPPRSQAALVFDEVTLAAFVVLVVVLIGSVFAIGVARSEDQIGCGLNDIVNSLMAVPQPCH